MARIDYFSLILDRNTIEVYKNFEVEQINDKPLCFECLLPVDRIKRCGRCLHAVYCGKECQTKAWKVSGHKISCGVVKVAVIGGEKGYGVIACRDIKEGDIVIMEKPLLNVSQSLHKLTEINKTLLSLDDSVKRKLMSLDSDHRNGDLKLPGIFRVNNFLGKTGNALVYHMISRLNHSCVPNIRVDVQSTDPNVFFTPVVALKAIREGEELVFDYLIESGKYSSRQERQQKLSQLYAISNCRCKACSLKGNKLIQSDNNRRQVKEVEQQLKFTPNPKIVKGLVEKKRRLLQAEGLDTMNNLMMLTKDLLLAALATSSSQEAKKYQEEGIRYAEQLHDQEMIAYFSKNESERMLEMLFS